MRGRPLLYTSYEADQSMLNTTTKKVVLGLFLAFLVFLPFTGGAESSSDRLFDFSIPFVGFLAANDYLQLLTTVCIFAIGALGLNLLTGVAGQVSLGHSFFMGVGAYTAVWLGAPEGPLFGMGLPIWIWLPAAGIVPAIIGLIVGPTAVRVRGLYLAIVTVGLVFIGEYVFRNWRSLTGGSQAGRSFQRLDVRLWKEETPLIEVTQNGPWLSSNGKSFLMLLFFLVVFTVLAKNLQRTRVGRAFQAIRDRDVAAEIMGVNEFRYKLLAFGISSFYAGIAGALLTSFLGRTIPERWDLILAVQFIAIILIGGAGTISGTLMGAAFVIMLPRVVQNFTEWLKGAIDEGGFIAAIADPIVATSANDTGIINTLPGVGPGLSVLQANQVLYG
ncbi:MAG TPA: branched-chain amino acid ABC transporter permease, partial [Acidimicrobiia bacterium]|nr:branched-chain amino acid ABC transporter permease [Acidimicrobiia bacterium]